MERNYCVIVLEANYSCQTDEVTVSYTNYRDIDGEEAEVAFFKNLFEEKVKGSFKV